MSNCLTLSGNLVSWKLVVIDRRSSRWLWRLWLSSDDGEDNKVDMNSYADEEYLEEEEEDEDGEGG